MTQGVVDIDYDNDLRLGGIIIQEGITSYAMEREAIRIKAWAGDPDPGLPTLPRLLSDLGMTFIPIGVESISNQKPIWMQT
ncbi:MAG: hypothetical protein R3C28_27815 [Pirellulaceae bacterium]